MIKQLVAEVTVLRIFPVDRRLRNFWNFALFTAQPLEIALKTTSSCGIWLAFKYKIGSILAPNQVRLAFDPVSCSPNPNVFSRSSLPAVGSLEVCALYKDSAGTIVRVWHWPETQFIARRFFSY